MGSLSQTPCCLFLTVCSELKYQAHDRRNADTAALYDSYYHWCEDNALTALKRETFVSWLRQNEAAYHIKYSTHIPNYGKNVRGFTGITPAHLY